MAPSDEKNGDCGDDLLDSSTQNSFQISPSSMHMYTFSSTSHSVRSKRRQVKNACTKCQKACKKCDQARPCLRCVKYGFGAEECVDSQRKERKKGAKRGPYKKRDGKGNIIAQSKEPPQGGDSPQPSAESAPATTMFAGSIPVGYNPGFYAHALPASHKPGEAMYYSQFYLAPVSSPPAGQEGERSTYPPQFFPATFMTAYAQPYPPYIVNSRPDAQMHYTGAPDAGSAAANVEPSGADDEEGDISDVPPDD